MKIDIQIERLGFGYVGRPASAAGRLNFAQDARHKIALRAAGDVARFRARHGLAVKSTTADLASVRKFGAGLA